MRCDKCGGGCYRRECLPYFQEDRRHQGGERFSKSLGILMPQSRAEQRRMEREMGVVFESPQTTSSPEAKAAASYHKAIEAGYSHEEAEGMAPWPKPPERNFTKMVDDWAERRHGEGKPLDALTDSEFATVSDKTGWEQRS